MSKTVFKNSSDRKAYIITGPTSGIGRATALELAKYGTVILVGRNPGKLDELQNIIEQKGQHAVSVVCDISDMISVRRAAQQIIEFRLPIVGLLNNAGIMPTKASKSAQGWDMTFATNHLGAFALTEMLASHLSDGANVVFIASAIEDPERKPAKVMGMRGGRFISVEASASGEWKEGGTKMGGIDAYATSKQCILAAAMAFAREITGISYSPYVMDVFLVYGYNPEEASGLYEEIMEYAGKIARLPEALDLSLEEITTND